MAFDTEAKPTPANLRRRVERALECARDAERIARHRQESRNLADLYDAVLALQKVALRLGVK